MRTLCGEWITAGVGMGIVRARTVVVAPPAIMQVIAVAVILHGVVNGRIRVPIGIRTAVGQRFRYAGLEDGRRFFALDPPRSRRGWFTRTACCDEKRLDQFAMIVHA